MEYVNNNRFLNKCKRVLSFLVAGFLKYLFYFTKQSRFDRAQIKKAFSGNSVEKSKKALQEHLRKKRESGRLLVQHGGVIQAKPFPPRGSLLTDEEKNDPMAGG